MDISFISNPDKHFYSDEDSDCDLVSSASCDFPNPSSLWSIPVQCHGQNPYKALIGFHFHDRESVSISAATIFRGMLNDAKSVDQTARFTYGLRLQSLHTNNAYFHTIDYCICECDNMEALIQDDSWKETYDSDLSQYAKSQFSQEVAFEEWRTVWPLGEPLRGTDRRVLSHESLFLISVFSANGSLDRLNKTWDRWSGVQEVCKSVAPVANSLCKCNHLKNKLRRLSFHSRWRSPSCWSAPMFVMLGELFQLDKEAIERAKLLTDKLTDRQCGVTSTYRIVQEINAIDNI